jgi:hypothetical protein
MIRNLPFKDVLRIELSLLALAPSLELMQNLWLSAMGTQGHKYSFKAEVDKGYKKKNSHRKFLHTRGGLHTYVEVCKWSQLFKQTFAVPLNAF